MNLRIIRISCSLRFHTATRLQIHGITRYNGFRLILSNLSALGDSFQPSSFRILQTAYTTTVFRALTVFMKRLQKCVSFQYNPLISRNRYVLLKSVNENLIKKIHTFFCISKEVRNSFFIGRNNRWLQRFLLK